MDLVMMANFITMIFKVKENILGLIKEFILVHGKKIKCMVKDKYLGKMEKNILEYRNS